ncbi:restriction endonuclease subunit S [Micromonospora sp. NPDC047707]|uniref:restriction endonuclease subunit S n=1 Tax=Micromonospora sp. NPDC047707 TaxID=3154498 RepID=UPI0034554382
MNDLQADEPRAITDGPFGSNLTSAHYTDSGPRVVRLQNIGDGVFHDLPAHISEEHFQALRRHEVLPGDLLVASLGETLPRACLAPAALGPAIVKADCIRVRLSPKVDSRWVMYAMQRPQVRKWADEHRHGVGRPRLGLKVIRQIPIPLPPLDQQRRIVDILEDHLSRLDAARAAVDNSGLRLSRFRQAMLQSVLNSAASAPGCSIRSIGQIALVGTGATPLKARRDFYEGGTIPWVTSADLAHGLIEHPAQLITPRALDETNVKIFPPGTLLVAMYGEGKTRGTVGELAVAATTNQACAAIQLNDPTPSNRAWVRMALEANYWQMRRLASGGVQPNLNLRLVRRIRIPFPDTETRDSILHVRAGLEDARHQLAITLERVKKRESSLRRALLEAAFSGRLNGQASDMDRVEEMAGV